jgi:spoIIIJ-associated protein
MKKEEVKNLIKELIQNLSLEVSDISVNEEGNNTWFMVEVSEPHFFTNREGEALMALNHLVKRIVESGRQMGTEVSGNELNMLVDVNGFQKKKIDAIKAVAHMMAERARYFKSSVEVEPMSSFDRRIVHEFLADQTDIKTESMGVGPSRRVVIKYIGAI